MGTYHVLVILYDNSKGKNMIIVFKKLNKWMQFNPTSHMGANSNLCTLKEGHSYVIG